MLALASWFCHNVCSSYSSFELPPPKLCRLQLLHSHQLSSCPLSPHYHKSSCLPGPTSATSYWCIFTTGLSLACGFISQTSTMHALCGALSPDPVHPGDCQGEPHYVNLCYLQLCVFLRVIAALTKFPSPFLLVMLTLRADIFPHLFQPACTPLSWPFRAFLLLWTVATKYSKSHSFCFNTVIFGSFSFAQKYSVWLLQILVFSP